MTPVDHDRPLSEIFLIPKLMLKHVAGLKRGKACSNFGLVDKMAREFLANKMARFMIAQFKIFGIPTLRLMG